MISPTELAVIAVIIGLFCLARVQNRKFATTLKTIADLLGLELIPRDGWRKPPRVKGVCRGKTIEVYASANGDSASMTVSAIPARYNGLTFSLSHRSFFTSVGEMV